MSLFKLPHDPKYPMSHVKVLGKIQTFTNMAPIVIEGPGHVLDKITMKNVMVAFPATREMPLPSDAGWIRVD